MPEDSLPGDARRHLSDLSIGASASVERLWCERSVARRLMEMGLLPGTTVEVQRIAPLGDPIELRLRGFSLSIRRSEAERIEIEATRAEATAAER